MPDWSRPLTFSSAHTIYEGVVAGSPGVRSSPCLRASSMLRTTVSSRLRCHLMGTTNHDLQEACCRKIEPARGAKDWGAALVRGASRTDRLVRPCSSSERRVAIQSGGEYGSDPAHGSPAMLTVTRSTRTTFASSGEASSGKKRAKLTPSLTELR